MLDLSPAEQDILVELLEHERKELLHQLHHADSRSFQRMLRERVGVVEELVLKARAACEAAIA